MSTYYRPTTPIPLRAIKINKNLKKLGFEVIEDENGTYFYHEGNYIHYAVDNRENVIDVFRYGGNNASKVLEPLEDEFEVDFVSEYDEEYDDYADEDTGVIQIHIGDLVDER